MQPSPEDLAGIRNSLRKLMWKKVGIVRTRKELSEALRQLRKWDNLMKQVPPDRSVFELKNMITASLLITRSALLREGSVGAHFRSDFPMRGKHWRKRTVVNR